MLLIDKHSTHSARASSRQAPFDPNRHADSQFSHTSLIFNLRAYMPHSGPSSPKSLFRIPATNVSTGRQCNYMALRAQKMVAKDAARRQMCGVIEVIYVEYHARQHIRFKN